MRVPCVTCFQERGKDKYKNQETRGGGEPELSVVVCSDSRIPTNNTPGIDSIDGWMGHACTPTQRAHRIYRGPACRENKEDIYNKTTRTYLRLADDHVQPDAVAVLVAARLIRQGGHIVEVVLFLVVGWTSVDRDRVQQGEV